jgi:HrpA-like RNA helicase
LFSRKLYARMDKYTTPEMCRTPIHQLCLQVKVRARFQLDADSRSLPPPQILGLGAVGDVLAQALTPPDSATVRSAVGVLSDVGALSSGEELTALGRHLAALPVDVRIGKARSLSLSGLYFPLFMNQWIEHSWRCLAVCCAAPTSR